MLKPLAPLALVFALTTVADEYPQWLGPRRDNVYREKSVLESFPPAGLKTLWRAPVAGGYSQVAIAPGKVIVTDHRLEEGAAPPKDPFDRNALPGTERVLCLDDDNGHVLWKVEYDCPYSISYAAGPRTTPAIDGDRVYTLGAQGHLYCIDINSGKPAWNKKLPGKPTIWGFAGSPLVEGDLLIILSAGNPLLTAFHKSTGEVAWTAGQAKDPGYVPPTPMTLNSQRQIIQYYPEGLLAVDPIDGKVLWQLAYGPEENGVTIVTPLQVAPDTFVLTSQYNGMAAVQISPDNQPKLLWHQKQKGRTISTLQSLHSQMVFHDGHVLGVHNTGQLLCVDPKDGHVVWSDPKPLLGDTDPIRWTAAFLTPWKPDPDQPPKHFFLATEKGDLILCDLSVKDGYKEISRTHLLDPTNVDAQRPVLWCHPAYAHQSIYWRNDRELIRASLTKP
jgi:outer membrane protein assembly factor BamB